MKQIVLSLFLVVLFLINLFVGSVNIPFSDVINILFGGETQNETWRFIVMESRLPSAITALFCGAALATSGLLLQTAFRNPLAGPSVFGINSGAGLGVALVMLMYGGSVGLGSYTLTGWMAVLFAAFLGAMLVTGIIFAFSSFVKNNVMLLIVGIMIGYIASSAITLLNFFATEEGVRSYMIWGMGDFSAVSMRQIPLFVIIITIGLIAALMLIKPLNAMLLGERYAESMGVNTRKMRNWLLIVTGILTAATTAFCGPIAFIGLAVPHIARLLLQSDNHRSLLPATILTGAAVALLCNIICFLPSSGGIIPLNAVTPLIGAPVIIYVITRK